MNEGAVFVGPSESVLTPVGEVMALYANHVGGQRLTLEQDENLDITATTIGDEQDLLITTVNLDAVDWSPRDLVITITPPPPAGAIVALTTLTATGYDVASTMTKGSSEAALGANGTLTLSVPPFSVVQASLEAATSEIER